NKKAMNLKGGLVGCGFFGQIQLEAWRRMPEAEIVAACDLDLERARRSAPRAYQSAEEMLDNERLDFVDIATTPETHLALVRLAAERRIPIICQKPMAPDWDQALAMVEAAEQAGVRLMIHENWRWQPWFRVVKQRIEHGDIGRPVGYSFRVRKNDGGGPAPYSHQPYFSRMPRLLIYETLVHQIDTARFLFGDIATVCAQARRINPVIAGEDQALILLTHQGGLHGAIDGHRFLDLAPDSPPLGDAVFEGDAGALDVTATGDVCRGATRLWVNDVRQGYRGDSVRATQQHFIACLASGAPFESEARDYLKTFGAVEAAYRSIAERRVVPMSEFL
ncbi:MAG: Gfo/Idh/MocA family oxidoreductase, partial [Acidobacteriota bacterium]